MIPEFIKNAKSGDILATKYGSLLMVARVEIYKSDRVRIYYYFDYDLEDGLSMNEWLEGFYGPEFEPNFYRPATEEEENLFLDKMQNFGYKLMKWYGGMQPHLTVEGYRKFYPCIKQEQ